MCNARRAARTVAHVFSFSFVSGLPPPSLFHGGVWNYSWVRNPLTYSYTITRNVIYHRARTLLFSMVRVHRYSDSRSKCLRTAMMFRLWSIFISNIPLPRRGFKHTSIYIYTVVAAYYNTTVNVTNRLLLSISVSTGRMIYLYMKTSCITSS